MDFSGLKTWSFAQSTADHPSAGSINQDDFFNSRVEYAIKQKPFRQGLHPGARRPSPPASTWRYHQVVNSEMSIAKLNSYAGYPDDMDMGHGKPVLRETRVSVSRRTPSSTTTCRTRSSSTSPMPTAPISSGVEAVRPTVGGGKPSGSEQDQIDKRVDKILADFPPS